MLNAKLNQINGNDHMHTDKTIFAGTKAFEGIRQQLGVIYPCNEIRHGDIKIKRDNLVPENDVLSLDPDIVEAMKGFELVQAIKALDQNN